MEIMTKTKTNKKNLDDELSNGKGPENDLGNENGTENRYDNETMIEMLRAKISMMAEKSINQSTNRSITISSGDEGADDESPVIPRKRKARPLEETIVSTGSSDATLSCLGTPAPTPIPTSTPSPAATRGPTPGTSTGAERQRVEQIERPATLRGLILELEEESLRLSHWVSANANTKREIKEGVSNLATIIAQISTPRMRALVAGLEKAAAPNKQQDKAAKDGKKTSNGQKTYAGAVAAQGQINVISEKVGKKGVPPPNKIVSGPPGPLETNEEDEDWREVRRNKKRKQKRENNSEAPPTAGKPQPKKSLKRHRPRGEAVEIQKKGSATNQNLLRTIKSRVKPDEWGAKISTIRTTRKGSIIIECSETRKMADAISAAVGEAATIKHLVPRMAVEVLDLDEAIDGQEVTQAIAEAAECPPADVQVRGGWMGRGGTRTVVLTLPSAAASKILTGKRIVIGWVSARVRPRVEVSRCFKCHCFGHVAAGCGAEVDRSGQCWRCGGNGHSYKSCEAEPCCVACMAEGATGKGAAHIGGSGRCPAFRRTLGKLKKVGGASRGGQ